MNSEKITQTNLYTQTIFQDMLQVDLPPGTEDMPEEMADEIYPYQKRPQRILYCSDLEMHFTFSIYDKTLSNQNVRLAVKSIMKMISDAYPGSIIGKGQLIEYTQNRIGWFAFETSSLEQTYYNIMFVTPVGGKLMLGTGVCQTENEDGREKMKQVLLSIRSVAENDPR